MIYYVVAVRSAEQTQSARTKVHGREKKINVLTMAKKCTKVEEEIKRNEKRGLNERRDQGRDKELDGI